MNDNTTITPAAASRRAAARTTALTTLTAGLLLAGASCAGAANSALIGGPVAGIAGQSTGEVIGAVVPSAMSTYSSLSDPSGPLSTVLAPGALGGFGG